MKICSFFAMVTVLAMGFAAAAAAATASEACQEGEIVIKFSHVSNTERHPKGTAAARLEKRVNAEMDGKVCMQVFPNSQLYNDDRVLEALLLNDVQMAAPSLSKFEKFTKKFRLFDLPFMFNDVDAVDRFQLSANGQELMDSMRHRGLQGLAFWHNGMKQFSANRPLIEPTDVEGLRFRVQPSDVLVAQIDALHGIPHKMAFSEVYGALQTGVVDGQENTWVDIYAKKFFEVQEGVTETNHGVIDYLVVVSTDWWLGLPADIRDQLSAILVEVTEIQHRQSARMNQEAKAAIIDAGGKVRQLTAQQRARWTEATKPVWSRFADDVSPALIAAAQAANAGQ
jgi:C4-dicarboxylate-binding protein DctP